ncbi:hypothetical protein Sulku_2474 [Sulfuricurvum kujiense DSM 16994]|uniref:Porin n=1 Tax=Sulfuricurvum kujiense (strain ATCC BAA-921 / DSM 16994 / JCM 11577 / YK-1) TaxID=709032 RepID=E4TYX3_SULKY|nr:outer membrane beta-barrel protein [Sulfuricurvum kujiense]ADR35133.1 hypothetical protein Sulku_2474 [Sulfuricurvum kujiense DSM 16994]
MYLRFLSLFSLTLLSLIHAAEYELGHGIRVNDAINVGGYFSTELESNQQSDTFTLDDVAVLAYGDINPMVSYLVELESVGFYHKNFTDGTETQSHKFHIERLYGDLWMSDDFNIRFGKQITPIGYWNMEPINVLRDTTSSPLYSKFLFPKFLTGIDINGYVPQTQGLKYHLFAQNNHDMDEEYINIPNTHFFGFALDQEISMDWNTGGSIGEYIAKTGQRTRFIQGNFKYDDTRWQVLTEALAAKSEYGDRQDDYTYSGYTQAMYRYSPEHALIGRYEYYNDHHTDYKDHILTLGYSYRPLYPVSLKGEYQWHSQNDENRALFSFSVLF